MVIHTIISKMNIFVYGTLQNQEVIKALVARELPHKKATLNDFRVFGLNNRYYPAIISSTGSTAQGYLLLDIDDKSLRTITAWEGDEYKPTTVTIEGEKVTCFVWMASHEAFIDNWDNEMFRRQYMKHLVRTKIPAFLNAQK